MPETVFSITSAGAMVAWVALIAARFIPALRRWVDPAAGYVLPALLSVAYGVLLFSYWGQSDGGGFASSPPCQPCSPCRRYCWRAGSTTSPSISSSVAGSREPARRRVSAPCS